MRVYLDAVHQSDLERFAAWFADPSLAAVLNPGVALPSGPEDEKEWFEGMRRRQREGKVYCFAVRRHEDGGVIGTVSLVLEAKGKSAMFGIAIADPGARGHGFGQEATELALRFAFDELGLHRVWLGVFDFNEPAKRLYRRVGFRDEGRQRDFVFRDGRYHDGLLMAMLEDEYRARTGVHRPEGWIAASVRPADPKHD